MVVKETLQEAGGPNGDLTPRTPLTHKSYVHRIVILAEKGLLSAVSSLSYMIGVSRYPHSCHSGQIQISTVMNASCQSKTSMGSPQFAKDVFLPEVEFLVCPFRIQLVQTQIFNLDLETKAVPKSSFPLFSPLTSFPLRSKNMLIQRLESIPTGSFQSNNLPPNLLECRMKGYHWKVPI